MDIQEIMNFISTVGFPIVMCCLMFKRMNAQDDKLTTIVVNNTESITKLCEKIETMIDLYSRKEL